MCMWFNPKVPPLFFSCQAAVRRSDILEKLVVGGGAVPSGHLTNVLSGHGAERAPNYMCRAGTVPSGHLTKCAERAQCRAGT